LVAGKTTAAVRAERLKKGAVGVEPSAGDEGLSDSVFVRERVQTSLDIVGDGNLRGEQKHGGKHKERAAVDHPKNLL
jgi:hypothetical protein